MKVLILAGGKGTRFMEESIHMPKPMIPILEKPMMLHIMEHYLKFGFDDFVVLGGEKIDYIYNYFEENNEVLDSTNHIYKIQNKFTVQILDTGKETMTGGRVKQAIEILEVDNFMLTYGDGFSDVNISKLLEFHNDKKSLATLTGMRPPARFGSIEIEDDYIVDFGEKAQTKEGWINGGYFVISSKIYDYISGDEMPLEREPLERLSKERLLTVFKHHGYFQPVDTIREKELVEERLSLND